MPRILAIALAGILAATGFTVLAGQPAVAADQTFLIDDYRILNDATPGDGACATSAGTCTLRAAVQEANATPASTTDIGVAEDVDPLTDGVQSTGTVWQGTVAGSGSPPVAVFNPGGLQPMQTTPAASPFDPYAWNVITAPSVTVNLDNRLGLSSVNDGNFPGAAFLVNAPGVVIRNFSNIIANETAIIASENADGLVIENGVSLDTTSINLERFLYVTSGADGITMRAVRLGSLFQAGVVMAGTINGFTLDRVTFENPADTPRDSYNGFEAFGNVVLNDLLVQGSTFDGFRYAHSPFQLTRFTLNDALFVDNVFQNGQMGVINDNYAYISYNTPTDGTGNVITGNIFRMTPQMGYAIHLDRIPQVTDGRDSGWSVTDNVFFGSNGGAYPEIEALRNGRVEIRRNLFIGVQSGDGIASEAGNYTVTPIYNEFFANNKPGVAGVIYPWYPVADGGYPIVDSAACTIDVKMRFPSTVPANRQPDATGTTQFDVYYLPPTSVDADVFLGTVEAPPGTADFIIEDLPLRLGGGKIRVQTIDSAGLNSQLSRSIPFAATDNCGPNATVEQAASQDDPTSVRDIFFKVKFDEPIADGSLTADDFDTSASTAAGVTVTSVEQNAPNDYTVIARANGTGTVVLSLPAGAVVDSAGVASLASTSVDNSVQYVSPLSVAPAAITVAEPAGSASFTITRTAGLSPAAPISITPTIAPSIATVEPDPIVIPTIATEAEGTVTAVDNAVVDGDRPATLSFTVTSDDPNFDGLILEPVAVTVQDDDVPVAINSTLEITTGTRAADGVDAHTVTATVRNAGDIAVSGALVTFTGETGATLTPTSCTTGADGTCQIQVTSSTVGSYAISAFINGTEELTDSPVTAEFAAGPADAATSTIAASALSIPAGGISTSTITVTLRDAQGNQLATGGDTVALSTTAGTLSAVTDNGDGTYTAILTSSVAVGTAVVSFTVNGAAGTETVTINFVAGEPSPSTSTIEAAPSPIVAGTGTSTVTVTLIDGFGNPVGAAGAGQDIELTTTLGTLGAVTDNGDGTYTATLTASPTVGTAVIGFTIDGVTATDTAEVEFVTGPVDPAQTAIEASPTSLTADGVSQSAVTVTLFDANGNQVTTGGATVVLDLTGTGTLSSVVDNGDGTYTAVLTAPSTPGSGTIGATVDGVVVPDTATVSYSVGAADPGASTIAADPTSITADGTSTSTVTVSLLDANGNPLTTGGDTVTIATSLGSIGAVSDNGDGTYTATLTSATTAGTATLSFTVNGEAGTATATVEFTAGAADATSSTITADPTSVVADGTEASTITVTLIDANGNPLTTGGDTVEIATTLGSLGAVTDNGDGTYSAIVTSTTAGTATLSFTVNGVAGTATATVEFTPGAVDLTLSTITADPTTIVADGASTSTITVELIDANGNPLGTSGGTVAMTTDLGTLSDVTDNGDGTYTATLTSATTAGTATVAFTLDGVPAPGTATVQFTAGIADPDTSTIDATPASITADGTSTSTVTVTLLDANGNVVTDAGDVVELTTDLGTLGPVTDNGDGTYTATLTSATTAGTATVSFTVDGVAGTATATVAFTVGTADPSTSTITAAPTSIAAGGTATSTITVTLLDANGNPVGTSAGTVTMTTDLGTLGAVTDNGDGTYTAILTSATTAGTATVSFAIDGVAGAATATVEFVAGPPDPATSTIAADPTSVPADGTSTSTITVTLLDANGVVVTDAGDVVDLTTDLGVLGPVTDNGDGTYTATITAPTTAGTATVGFSVDGIAATATATVVFTAGAVSPTTSTIAAVPSTITADGISTSTITVTLRDPNGNVVTDAGDVVAISTSLGTVGAVTDNGDGTYTATLTSATTAGTATVSFAVDGTASPNTASVVFTPGEADPASSTIAADPTSITADGTSTSTVTVTLVDANGNPLDASGGTVVMTTDLGTLGAVTDNGDGTYTATLTSDTTAGTATVSFTVNGTAGTATATVEFTPGTADPGTSTITADPAEIPADGTSTSTITVTLLDANGNPLGESGGTVTMATDAGTLGPVTDNGDGTYTATLTAPTSTTPPQATITFTVDGVDATATANVDFLAGEPSTTTSTIAAAPTSIVADGVSTSTIIVTLLDGFGNLVTDAGDVVTLTTTAGTLGSVTDNGDGTYEATLTSSTTADTATVGFAVSGEGASATATVEFTTGAPSAADSTIVASPTSIAADGASTSAVTVTLFDANGNRLTTGGATVVITTDAGAISTVTDNGDGTYTATLTSSTTVATATLGFTVDGAAGAATATVEFTVGAADAGTSTIAAAPDTIESDGVEESTITVTLLDAQGNPLTAGGDTVVMTTTIGTITGVTDNGDGTYTATLTSTDTGIATVGFTVNGASAAATASVTIQDTTPPATAPVITGPVDGASIQPDAALSGTGQAGATVIVRDGAGTEVCTAVVDSTGNWSCNPATPFAEGPLELTATQADAAGNESLPSATVSVTVDGTPPAAPTVDPVPPTNDTTPTFTGEGEPGSTIDIVDQNGDVVCTTTVQPDGTWSCTPTEPLPEGTSTLTPEATDPAGNGPVPGDPVTVVVDTELPAEPSIDPVPPTNDPTPTFTGEGEPGSTIDIVDGDGNTVCTTTVQPDGTWSCTPTDPLPEGESTLTPQATDPAGNGPVPGDPVTVTVDATDPTAPTIDPVPPTNDTTPTFTGEGEPGSTIDIVDGNGTTVCTTTVGDDGSWSCTPTEPLPEGTSTLTPQATDPAGNGPVPGTPVEVVVDTAAPPAPTLDPVPPTSDTTPTFTGTGEPGSTIDIVDSNGTTVCTTTVGDDGTWSCTPTDPLPEGTSTLTPQATDPAGNGPVPGDPVNVVIDNAPPTAPTVDPVPPTNDTTPTFTGTGEPGSTIDIVDQDGNTVCATTVGDDGTWSCTPTEPLPEGETILTPEATDPAGNGPVPGDPVTVIVDTEPPTAPTVDPVPPTSDTTPTFTGEGEPGSTIDIVDQNGDTVCTTTVQPDGTWSCTPTEPLPEGETILTPEATDPAGNGPVPGDPVTVVVDTELPAEPSIDPVPPTNDTTPTFTGEGEPGSTIDIVDQDGNTVCTTTVQPDGTWSCTPTDPLPEGESTLTPQATDPAGNGPVPGDPVTVTVDTTDPAAPTVDPVPPTNDSTPTFTGEGEPGSTIDIVDQDGNTVCTTTVQPDGSWSCTPTEPLPEGTSTLTPQATDPAGNGPVPGTPVEVVVDSTPPAAPVITGPTPGAELPADEPLTISGTGDPGATVTVTDGPGGPTLCTTTVAADGTWSCTLAEPLGPGVHDLVATQTDALGNTSPPTTVTVVQRPAVDLSVTASVAPTSVQVGQTATITVSVTNLGPDGDVAVQVVDPITGAIAYVSHTATVGTYDPATGIWTVGSLAVGDTATLEITIRGAAPGTAVVPFVISGTSAEIEALNNTAEVTITVVAAVVPQAPPSVPSRTPSTGFEALPPALLAGLLLLLGSALVIGARRRQGATASRR